MRPQSSTSTIACTPLEGVLNHSVTVIGAISCVKAIRADFATDSEATAGCSGAVHTALVAAGDFDGCKDDRGARGGGGEKTGTSLPALWRQCAVLFFSSFLPSFLSRQLTIPGVHCSSQP